MDLSEVLKLLSASQQTGMLKLVNPQNAATIAVFYLQVGQLTHAQSGSLTGLDAMSACCRLSEEAFAFQEQVMVEEQTLAVYPTAKLLDKMAEEISDAKSLHLAMPGEDDVPIYQHGATLAGLEATADDLSLLILCNGSRTVRDLARDVRRSIHDTASVLAKFRKAGIIEISREPSSTAPAAAEPLRSPPPAGDPAASSVPPPSVDVPKQPRYWRGKLIDE